MAGRTRSANRKSEQGKETRKLQGTHRFFLLLQDMILINAILLSGIALVYLADIARYQWLLYLILGLGILLNASLTLGGILRGWIPFSVMTALLAAGLLAALIYLQPPCHYLFGITRNEGECCKPADRK